jgi:AcrR family transcriptional regulator
VLKSINHSETRTHILEAALKSFARSGYAATSVQHIVKQAGVSKPALYYYFADKAKLFAALVDRAHDERYRLMQEAAKRGRTVAEKLEEIVSAIFEFSLRNSELMRLQFATAFAASGEAPGGLRCREKGRRNFEFIKALIKSGQGSGELNKSFTVDELTMGIYGQLNSYIMVRLLMPDCPLDRGTAERIVKLFVEGSAVSSRGPSASGRNAGFIRQSEMPHGPLPDKSGVPTGEPFTVGDTVKMRSGAPNGGKKNGNGSGQSGGRSGDISVPVKDLRGRGRPRSLPETCKESPGEKKKWAAAERVRIKFRKR